MTYLRRTDPTYLREYARDYARLDDAAPAGGGGAGAGTATGTATATGAAGVDRPGAGTATGTATATGWATTGWPASGTATSTATATGAAGADRPGAGTATATATASGDTTATRPGAGTANVIATASGAAGAKRPGAGTATSTATASGAAGADRPGAGTATSTATASGAAGAKRPGAGTASSSATATGAATVTGASWDFHAMVLERSNGEVVSGADAAKVDLTGDFTFEMWVDTIALSAGEIYMLAGKGTGTSTITGWYAFFYNNSGTTYFRFATADGSVRQRMTWTYTPPASWVHHAVTWDASGPQATATEWYRDGVSQGNGSKDTWNEITSMGTNNEPLEWGEMNGSNAFDGNICELRLWSDIRTGTEIADNDGVHLDGTEANLVFYVPNDGSSAVTDESSSPLTMTATGVTLASTDLPF